MTATTFLRLQDVLLPPPLSALVGVLMVAGIAHLGWRAAARLRKDRVEALDIAAGFVAVVAAIATIVHGVALAQLASLRVLRPMGWGLAAVGAFATFRHRARITGAVRGRLSAFWQAPALDRAALIVTAVTVGALGFAALGPPTDADSLDYHLGLALEWLRHGGAHPRPDWFPSRLAGITESVNMLGLAAGTDSLGAGLQFGGMIAAGVALCSFAATPRDQLFAWLLIASCPAMLFLVPNQKPQMLPAAATTIAVVMAVRRFDDLQPADAILALTATAFAVASKATFVFSAGFVVAVCIAAGRKSNRTTSVFATAAVSFALLPLPLLLRNLVFFGDPLSPFLERFRPHPDPELTFFADYLKTVAGELTLGNLLRLPLDIVATRRPAEFSTVLGIGALAFIPALRASGRSRLLLWVALGASVVCVILGQLAARFFLEPFLWAGAAAVAAGWTRRKQILLRTLSLQGAVTALAAIFGAANLFPGALTPGLRHAVLTRAAAGFAEAEWLDQVLPPDAVVVSNSRFHVFSPRPFVVADRATSAVGARADDNMTKLVVEGGVTYLVVDDEKPVFARFSRRRCARPVAGPRQFRQATRNPMNVKPYDVQVFRLDDCAGALIVRP